MCVLIKKESFNLITVIYINVRHFVIEINETLIKGQFLGFHNTTAQSLGPSLHCISCLLEHYLVAMQPDDKDYSLKGAQTAVFPGTSRRSNK